MPERNASGAEFPLRCHGEYRPQTLLSLSTIGGTADQTDATLEPVQHVAQRQERADRRGAHEVVAAAVPDARKSVVLAEDRDHRSAVSGFDRECRLEAAGGRLGVRPFRTQICHESVGRETLLERELRMRMDREREPIERRSPCIDTLGGDGSLPCDPNSINACVIVMTK